MAGAEEACKFLAQKTEQRTTVILFIIGPVQAAFVTRDV